MTSITHLTDINAQMLCGFWISATAKMADQTGTGQSAEYLGGRIHPDRFHSPELMVGFVRGMLICTSGITSKPFRGRRKNDSYQSGCICIRHRKNTRPCLWSHRRCGQTSWSYWFTVLLINREIPEPEGVMRIGLMRISGGQNDALAGWHKAWRIGIVKYCRLSGPACPDSVSGNRCCRRHSVQ